ncbi:methyl-accepting chemotaxis protein [Undibacterium sp. SXout20W]|uniref:methyl-accepting chemotaxis protein n=1 Tax=Undibacterium sp. SXout20W TaxID=3413051 RepID=UPI003BF06AF6
MSDATKLTVVRRVSPEMQEFLAAPKSEPVHKDAFHAHGLLTLGVVLMRNLRFKSKAFLICMMFIIPMSILTWMYFSNVLENIRFSEKERIGIEYTRQIFPVINLAQQVRRDSVAAAVSGTAPATLPSLLEKLRQEQQKLDETQKRYGKDLGVEKSYASLQDALSKIPSATPADVFKLHTAYVQSLINLMGQVSDGSNLTLDPEIVSFYLMDAALVRAPDIIESSAKIRGIGGAVLKAASITKEQQNTLSGLITITEFQGDGMISDLAKVSENDSKIGEKINAKQVLDDTRTFFALARKSVIDNQDYAPETQAAFLAAANKTIESQYGLVDKLINELDHVLADRVSAMKQRLYFVSTMLIAFVLAALYGFYTFYLVTSGGLKLISLHLKKMSEGDLRKAPALPWGKDEPAQVIHDVRHTYDALHGLIKTVRHSARALHATSSEVSAASLDLSSRAESAAASLEEQSATIEEISSIVSNNAEQASFAANFATDNAKVAEQGGAVISTVVSTMQDIRASSSKINEIIGVINGIAFQTNILALNAAVEAARAGEQGRGFAVVASEVRNLAQRSAAAADEIKVLISSSVEQITTGTKVVEQAGTTMETMVNNARQISISLSEISAATKEQSLGLNQITSAIQELDENTQSNAALVEETSAAASALTDQASKLQLEIASFRVA